LQYSYSDTKNVSKVEFRENIKAKIFASTLRETKTVSLDGSCEEKLAKDQSTLLFFWGRWRLAL
jgi:hypothetical protein